MLSVPIVQGFPGMDQGFPKYLHQPRPRVKASGAAVSATSLSRPYAGPVTATTQSSSIRRTAARTP